MRASTVVVAEAVVTATTMMMSVLQRKSVCPTEMSQCPQVAYTVPSRSTQMTYHEIRESRKAAIQYAASQILPARPGYRRANPSGNYTMLVKARCLAAAVNYKRPVQCAAIEDIQNAAADACVS